MPEFLLAPERRWQFWVDRGGTFTDIVAKPPEGALITHKLLSENPEQYADATVAGIKAILGLNKDQLISAQQVAMVKMGTTVATNALLEAKGEPTLLVITQGYADALRIAYQHRPRLFDRQILLPQALYNQVIEAEERVGAEGDILQPLNTVLLQQQLQQAFAQGLRSVAIVFMHGYQFKHHEQLAKTIAAKVGFTQISCSHEVSPLIKLIGRGDTTVVDAYLSPILRRYVEQIEAQMPGVPLFFMQSSGGLTAARSFQGKDAILSGPAGGIVGMVRTGLLADHQQLIGFDMGGTSTDVSHYAGELERDFDTQVAGVRIRAPMLKIHTVAAGGGSILRFDGERFRVGPQSAGADPGPASYRRGGPLTVTDANLLLGKIQADYFPKVFGLQANQALDSQLVQQQFDQQAVQVGRSVEQVAAGFIHIAVQQMANAIKKISVARGYDVTGYTLQCFGGAGGQHACLVADELGIKRIFIHPLAGVLSAYGMGLADQSVIRQHSVEKPLDHASLDQVNALLDELSEQARQALEEQFCQQQGKIEIQRRWHLRYAGTDTALVVADGHIDALKSAFAQAYKQRFSFLMAETALIVESVSVEARLPGQQLGEIEHDTRQINYPAAKQQRALYSAGSWYQAGLYVREQLKAGDQINGPALIVEQHATTVVESGWCAQVTRFNHLELFRSPSMASATTTALTVSSKVDPVMLEVFNNLFMNVAEQMGLQLQNTAYSVNIKERLDFSCAIFDASGDLIANAPHVPVHLGSMGDSIKTIINQNAGNIRPGDVYILNDPYDGGTHLPDITAISPVFIDDGPRPQFFVGSRGHHADVGGITPGSMPAFSTHIDEEGLRLSNFKLVDQGHFAEAELLSRLGAGAHPARNPQQNIADLKAQIAANETGIQALQQLTAQFGIKVVKAYMQHVQDNAEAAVRRVIATLKDGHFTVKMDNGALIAVTIRVDKNKAGVTIDFSDSSAQMANNFNAPRSVTCAAVLYVFRCLVADDIPLNAGCMKPIRLIIPEGCLLNPRYPAAVVAGNVETSTCITNALFGALGVMASSQPTMNNFSFGNQQYQYYETIAGGSGAGGVFDASGKLIGGFAGASVVQTHMTNSRLTDPEVLEARFPVRLLSFTVKTGSGGEGGWRGGNGAVRRLQFLQAMTASILSNGRLEPAFGLAGGRAGHRGVNYLLTADGRQITLDYAAEVALEAGDIIEIHTPGGGGFGQI